MNSHEFQPLGVTNICSVCYLPLAAHHKPKPLQTLRNVCRGCGVELAESTANQEICDSCSATPASVLRTIELENDRKADSASDQKNAEYLAQQSAEISRQQDIAYIKDHQKHMTGRDIAERLLQHEEFVCLNFNDKPNWADLYEAHQIDLEKKIEQFRCDLMATRKALTKKRMEETTKLTPEERAQYLRDQKKKEKKTAAEEEKAAAKTEWKQNLKNLTTLLGKDAARLKLEELYKSKGKEIPE